MGIPKQPQLVKLFTGILISDLSLLPHTHTRLQEEFGETDIFSPIMDFTYTQYYEPEMGPGLKRQFLSFKNLTQPDRIVDIKLNTNSLEDNLAIDNKRRVNLDPGYLTPASIVLVTTKDFSHRIYLSKGIYAEITLLFRHGKFEPLPWTYPDYRSPEYHQFFQRLRERYMEQRARS